MFTGIIQHLGVVADLSRTGGGCVLHIDAAGWDHVPQTGESIAVNGCCLTINSPPESASGLLRFDLSQQTLIMTALGELAEGDSVNLEHAMRMNDLIGGHIVQGHVDGVGRVASADCESAQARLRIEPPPELLRFICDKGSIAVNGVSLTVASMNAGAFEIALIPTTLELTNLRHLAQGDRVNLEVDYLARITINWLEQTSRRPDVPTSG